ncbi:hypothetical protein JCM11641_002539 [Rhodosporidiobolus odoratus]
MRSLLSASSGRDLRRFDRLRSTACPLVFPRAPGDKYYSQVLKRCLDACTRGSFPVSDGTCAACPAPFAKCSSATVATGWSVSFSRARPSSDV